MHRICLCIWVPMYLGCYGCVFWCVKPLLDRLLSMSVLEGLACLLMYMHGLWLLLFLWYTLCHMLHMELRTPSFCSLFLTLVKICLNVFLDFQTTQAYNVTPSRWKSQVSPVCQVEVFHHWPSYCFRCCMCSLSRLWWCDVKCIFSSLFSEYWCLHYRARCLRRHNLTWVFL